nr:probable LRR receptor-like serine/threonine-protein kinase At5g48740 [Ipomoea batatas]
MDFHWRLCLCLLSFAVFIQFALGDQEGFLSLSCGGSISYVDSLNISWIPDGAYVSSGNTTTVDFVRDGSSSSSTLPVRFFPDSEARKCYRLPVANNVSSLVLVRAGFVYKNYDGLNTPPAFSVSLGRAITTSVNLADADPWVEEFVWQVDKDILPICFHSFPHSGFPVISSLELRPLPQGAYAAGLGDSPNKLLRKTYRINCGYNAALRYPVDEFDRIWDADEDFSPFHVSSGVDVQSNFNNMSVVIERPPPAVLETARVLARWRDMTYTFPLDHHLGLQGDYYVVLYFAGILPVPPTFDVLINGDVFQSNYTVSRWEVASLAFTLRGTKSLNVTLKTISYYPLLNALEVYEILDIPWETSSTTVSALQVIQQSTGLDLGDLHNTSLTGEIQNLGGLQYLKKLNLSFNQLTAFGSELEDLVNLQVLDLQNNSLQGIVPDNLGELKDLHLLNLENNKLQGPLPRSLNRESLKIRASGNLCLSFSTTFFNDFSINPSIETPQVTVLAPKKHKAAKNKLPLIIGAVVGSVLSLSLVLLAVFLYVRYKERARDPTYASRRGGIDMKNWRSGAKVFSYKEIKTATNNFKEVIGRGSFGSVYLGKLPDGKQVAVKVRFDKTQLGADSFINEVCLLSQIRHQNLVSLEGFCQESKQQILVYEYLPGGSLADNLYGGYYSTRQLTEKSDVYSFGVVLLELICGREPLDHSGTPDSFNLVLWAKPYLQAGAFEIVDESIKGSYDEESMRRAALIASTSVERDALRRPNIAQVLAELKEAYSIQLSYLASAGLAN